MTKIKLITANIPVIADPNIRVPECINPLIIEVLLPNYTLFIYNNI